MIMGVPVFWWSLAAVLVLLELMTGTVYLLMVALGFVAGGISAHFELQTSSQLVIAGLVSSAATLTWHALRTKRDEPAPAADKNMQMDIGETLDVQAWDANGTARVMYRGAEWSVKSSGAAFAATPLPTGAHRIIEVRGNTLVVSPLSPTSGADPACASGTRQTTAARPA